MITTDDCSSPCAFYAAKLWETAEKPKVPAGGGILAVSDAGMSAVCLQSLVSIDWLEQYWMGLVLPFTIVGMLWATKCCTLESDVDGPEDLRAVDTSTSPVAATAPSIDLREQLLKEMRDRHRQTASSVVKHMSEMMDMEKRLDKRIGQLQEAVERVRKYIHD